MTDVPIPATVEGQSFAPVFKSQPAPRKSVFAAYTKLHRMVRDDRWKLIEWNVKGKRTIQLFDLQADPAELTDLANDPAHVEERKRMETLLTQYKHDLDDPAAK
jgi:arylsulfatase A-like enzyme